MTQDETAAANAIERAIPLLILLGNFVANDHGRCETIGLCRDALDILRGAGCKQPQSVDLPPPFVPTMGNRP